MRSKKALRNVGTNLLLQIVVVIYGFIVPKIIISQFGSSVNGLISSITQFLGYIVLLESGFGPVVKAMLYKPIAKKDKVEIASILKASNKFFKRIAFIFIGYILVLLFVYPLIVNREFSYLFTISLLLIISISTFAEYFFGMTYKLYLQAEQKSYISSIIQILTYILSTILIIILVKLNVSVHVIKLVSSLVFVLRPILQNMYVKRKYDIDFSLGVDNYKIEKKWDGLAQHIASVIHSKTDVTVLTIFCTLIEVSVYSVYYMVVKGIKSIVQAFTNGIDASFGDMLAKKENDLLNKNFELYEVIYNSISTVIYSCTLVLIVPFIAIYTKNFVDADYVRYTFGFLIVLSEYIWAIRLPYSAIIHAAGHFKETRIGAWVEAGSNIIISIILVSQFGLIGVAIGTCVAMSIRTIEFIYHVNKHILKRSIFMSIKKLLLIIIETAIIVVSANYLIEFNKLNYFSWIINAIIVSLFALVVVFAINGIFYRKVYVDAIKIVKNVFKRKSKKNVTDQNN